MQAQHRRSPTECAWRSQRATRWTQHRAGFARRAAGSVGRADARCRGCGAAPRDAPAEQARQAGKRGATAPRFSARTTGVSRPSAAYSSAHSVSLRRRLRAELHAGLPPGDSSVDVASTLALRSRLFVAPQAACSAARFSVAGCRVGGGCSKRAIRKTSDVNASSSLSVSAHRSPPARASGHLFLQAAPPALRAATSASASSTAGGAMPSCLLAHHLLASSVRRLVLARTAGRKTSRANALRMPVL